jgi:hypothetical protein
VKSSLDYNPLFIPPVLSDLEKLASGDPEIHDRYRKLGQSPENALERLVWIAFRMLGYEVEELGHMTPGERTPDGIAYAKRDHYAMLLDSKVGSDGYSMGTDDRALIEYITTQAPRLESEGIDSIYFCIISSRFKGDNQPAVLRIRRETRAKNITFLRSGMLLRLVELKIQNPRITLANLHAIFLRSELIEEVDIRRELGELIKR